VHVPTATSVTVVPDTVHRAVVCELKLTESPELALPLTVGAVPIAAFESAPKVIVWLPCVTWKLWFTGVAGAQLLLPDCVAWIVQVPTETSVTVDPDTVHTGAVCELKLTARPEVAVALTGKAAVPNGSLGSAPKVMVWLPCVTWKLWFTGVAAAQLLLPAWVAWIVQVPTDTSVTVELDTVHTAVVCELKLTDSPELAVALTVGAVPIAAFESAPKMIVWLPCVTWKLWFTGVAAAQVVLPACVAWIVQVPTDTSVTVDPDSVHTGVVCELKLTARPEVAVALTGKAAVPNGSFESAPKVIVWLPCVTWKL